MDINQLVMKSRQGDMEAYRCLVIELGPSVRAFFGSRLNDYHAVDDLSQEAFIAAYRSLDKFTGRGNFRSWLLSICRNKLMDYMRRHYSQSNLKVAYEEEIQTSLDNELNEWEMITKERLSKLQNCLTKLPKEAEELIRSRYFLGETVISLAERLQSSENAISSKLFRLKTNLKKCINHS